MFSVVEVEQDCFSPGLRQICDVQRVLGADRTAEFTLGAVIAGVSPRLVRVGPTDGLVGVEDLVAASFGHLTKIVSFR